MQNATTASSNRIELSLRTTHLIQSNRSTLELLEHLYIGLIKNMKNPCHLIFDLPVVTAIPMSTGHNFRILIATIFPIKSNGV